MTAVSRERLESLIWRQAPALCGPHPEAAMAAILAAVDQHASERAKTEADVRVGWALAGLYVPDSPGVTARRRAVLLRELRAYGRDHPRQQHVIEATHQRQGAAA